MRAVNQIRKQMQTKLDRQHISVQSTEYNGRELWKKDAPGY